MDFFHAWKSPEIINEPMKYRRYAYTSRTAFGSAGLSNFIIALVFFGHAASQMVPISSLGIFLGFLILINFLIEILFFLPAMVFYEFHIHGKISSMMFPVQE